MAGCGWSWVVVRKSWLVVGGRKWSWMVAWFSNARLIIMKMKMKIRLYRYDIIRARPRHGYKYTKYTTCLSMMMVMCNKQHLSNIWSWIYGNVKQRWGWVEKNALHIKKACIVVLLKHNGFMKPSTISSLSGRCSKQWWKMKEKLNFDKHPVQLSLLSSFKISL